MMFDLKQWKESIVQPKVVSGAMLVFAVFLIAALWLFTLSRENEEYALEISAEMRTNSNLAKAFEENVRQNLKSIDEILLFLQEGYRAHGQVTAEMVSRMNHTGHIPKVHVSMIDGNGFIFASSLPGLIGMDVSKMEYFQHFKTSHDNHAYFGKPVIGQLTRQPLFHMSRILYKPDGSFGGALNFGVEPQYFSSYYNKMELGKGYAISIIGRDGFIRIRQSSKGMSVGDDVRNGPVYQRFSNGSNAGNIIDVSAISKVKSLLSYVAMPDYPLAVVVMIPEAEVLSDFNQRRGQYFAVALLMSLIIAISFVLIHWLFKLKSKAEQQLNERMVEYRARQILQKEVERAGKIQAEMLVENYDGAKITIRTLFKPVHLVSGDYYNYVVSDDENLIVGYLVDVTGHGVSTAMQTAAVSAILNDEMHRERKWSIDSLRGLEVRIQQHLSDASFVAVLLFSIDCRQKIINTIIGGINHFLLSNCNTNGWVAVEGGYLGIIPDMQFGALAVPFQPGDTVYFMTDGLYDMIAPTDSFPVHDFDETMRRLQTISEDTNCRDDISLVGIHFGGGIDRA